MHFPASVYIHFFYYLLKDHIWNWKQMVEDEGGQEMLFCFLHWSYYKSIQYIIIESSWLILGWNLISFQSCNLCYLCFLLINSWIFFIYYLQYLWCIFSTSPMYIHDETLLIYLYPNTEGVYGCIYECLCPFIHAHSCVHPCKCKKA